MTAAETTGGFMLSKEIEILMAERARLLRVAGAAAQFVAVMENPRRKREFASRGHAERRSQFDQEARMNPDAFNMSIRKFLKMVGVNSQREIESAVERAIAAGKLKGNESLPAKMTLVVDGVTLDVTFDGKISLE